MGFMGFVPRSEAQKSPEQRRLKEWGAPGTRGWALGFCGPRLSALFFNIAWNTM